MNGANLFCIIGRRRGHNVSGEAMEMKNKIKVMLCAVLAVAAVLSLLATLAGIGALDVSAAAEGQYLLCQREGYVAVFCLPERSEPMTVTDIRVATLPAADRKALAAGIPAGDPEELLALLEDLSS